MTNPWDEPGGGTATAATKPSGKKFEPITGESLNKKVVVYGPGGIGKTTFMAGAPGKTAIIDIDRGAGGFERFSVDNFLESLELLRDSVLDPYDNVFVDSGSRWQDFAQRHVLDAIRTSNGGCAESIEDYGFGKGFTHIAEQMTLGFAALDDLFAKGKTVGMICHEISCVAPNPFGEDFMRYEPRLLAGQKNGSGNVRALAKEWSDHLLFIGYDLAVDKKTNKATGAGTRTIYTQERPYFWAKSRGLPKAAYPYTKGDDGVVDTATLWNDILKGTES